MRVKRLFLFFMIHILLSFEKIAGAEYIYLGSLFTE